MWMVFDWFVQFKQYFDDDIQSFIKHFQKMAEFSIFSPYEDRSKDSSEENLDDSLDDGGTVPDSGVSEAGSQMSEDVPSEASTISVSDEIRRFQKEINSVAVENSKFFKWKQQRSPSTKLLSSSENLQAISYSSEGKVYPLLKLIWKCICFLFCRFR